MLNSIPALINQISSSEDLNTPQEIAETITKIFDKAQKVRLTFPEHLRNYMSGNLTADCRFLIFILSKVLQSKGINTQTIIRCKQSDELHPKLLITYEKGQLFCLHFKKDEYQQNFNVKFETISEEKMNQYSILQGSPENIREFLDRLHLVRKLLPKDGSKRLDLSTKLRAKQLLWEIEMEFVGLTNNKFFEDCSTKFV